MSKYIDADKLKAKVDSFMDNLWKVLPDCSNVEVGELSVRESSDLGAYKALESVMYMIDSLQKEEPIQTNTLTWKDINDLERIINNVHYEFRNGIGEKSFGEEVLARFREERDEQEQPEADFKIEEQKWIHDAVDNVFPEDGDFMSEVDFRKILKDTARHFYTFGKNTRKEE